ncbi:peptidylprolyl isomerase [Camponotus japonicus]
MFWALILEPLKRHTEILKDPIHISMASLDRLLAADNQAVQVMVHYNKKNFLLCTLMKDKINQVPLDLKFKRGTEITLFSNGRGCVHLTGYKIIDPDSTDFESSDSDWSDSEEEKVKKVKKLKQKSIDDCRRDLMRLSTAYQKKQKAKLSKAKQESFDKSNNQDDDEFLEEDSDSEYEVEDDDDDDDDYDDYDDDDDYDDEEEEEEQEEEEEEEEKQKEKQEQEHKQKKLAKSQKQEKKIENQQQKKKHDKQNKINGKEIKQEQQNTKQKGKLENQAQQNGPSVAKKRIIEGGVIVEDIKLGSGPSAKYEKDVSIYYVGRCKIGKEYKKVEARTRGKGHTFRIGKGQVIKGWDVGIVGMKAGGKRRLTVPPDMAYGSAGFSPTIPPFSTIIYEIELKTIHN